MAARACFFLKQFIHREPLGLERALGRLVGRLVHVMRWCRALRLARLRLALPLDRRFELDDLSITFRELLLVAKRS